MPKKKLMSVAASIALAGGLVFAGAVPANAVPARDVGPFPSAGSCNFERTTYKQAHPNQKVTSCINSLGTGNWWFTIYL